MNGMFLLISGVFAIMLALCFMIGFFRGWCKSLIRLGIVLAIFLLALFLTSALSSVFDRFINGSEISILGTSFNLENFFKEYFGSDLDSALETTTQLAATLILIIVKIVIFVISFFALNFFSLVVYWIVSTIVTRARKEDIREEIIERFNENKKSDDGKSSEIMGVKTKTELSEKQIEELMPRQSIWLKLLGGFEGMVGAVFICLVILVPVFGVTNILDKAVKVQSNEAVAAAYSPSNFICGELFYTEDEDIGKIETKLEKYESVRKSYNSSPMGFILKYTGVEKLGSYAFNYLTSTEIDDKKVKISDEIATIIDTYGLYKDIFKKNKFNIRDDDAISKVRVLYNKATNSVYVKKYIEDLIPVMADNWSRDETFINIKNPIPETFKPVANDLLKVFSSARRFNNINNNINAILNFAERVSEQGIIGKLIDENNFIDVLRENKTFVKDAVIDLSSTYELKNNIGNALNNALVLIYDIAVGDGQFSYTEVNFYESEISSESEAEIIQNIINDMIVIFDTMDNASGENKDELAEQLGLIGRIIDYGRESKYLSNSLESFIVCYINSDKINLGENSESLKSTIIGYINDNWSIEENPEFSFEKAFETIAETIKVANDILSNKQIIVEGFTNALEKIIDNEVVKNVITNAIKNDVILEFVGDSDTAKFLTDIVETFVENTTSETLKSDIEATKTIIDVIGNGDRVQLDSESSTEIVETIAKSDAIISMIDKVTSSDNTTGIKDLADGIGEENKIVLRDSINNSNALTENQKTILNSLFS